MSTGHIWNLQALDAAVKDHLMVDTRITGPLGEDVSYFTRFLISSEILLIIIDINLGSMRDK
jgi:hypothetical protein